MAFKKATSGVESEWKDILPEAVLRGDALFLRTRRITDQPAKGERHPTGYAVDCEVWFLDGPLAGKYIESAYIFEAGMLNKMDLKPGGHSAGQLEVYGKGFNGLTEMTPAQHALAEAKDRELDAQEKGGSGGVGTPVKAGAGVGSGRTYDDEPPFLHGFADGSNPYREQPVVV